MPVAGAWPACSSVLPAWKVHGMKAVKPPVSSCRSRMRRRCSTRSAGVSSEPNIMVAVVFMPRPWATRITSSHVSVGILCGLMAVRTRSTSTSAPPPGSAVEAGGVEPRQRLLHAQPALLGDVHDLRRRERVDVDRVARLDAAEDLLEPADVEVRVQAALHHDGGAAERQRLLDLAVDVRLGEQVALPAPRLLVEGAEAAAGEAVVGVVDVAVDDEGDLVAGVQAATDGVGAGAGAQQVAALEQRERLGVGHAARRLPAHEASRSSRLTMTTKSKPTPAASWCTGRPPTVSSPGSSSKPTPRWKAIESVFQAPVSA